MEPEPSSVAGPVFLPANLAPVQRTADGSLELAAEERSELVLARVTDYSTDVPYAYRLDPASLLKLPHVHAITVVPAKRFKRRIVHVLAWNIAPLQYAFSEEEKQAMPEAVRQRLYDTWVDGVEAADKEQQKLLAKMIEMCEVKGVYLEGLATDFRPIFRKAEE